MVAAILNRSLLAVVLATLRRFVDCDQPDGFIVVTEPQSRAAFKPTPIVLPRPVFENSYPSMSFRIRLASNQFETHYQAVGTRSSIGQGAELIVAIGKAFEKRMITSPVTRT